MKVKYKVIARKDVRILAYERSEIIEDVGGAIGRRPIEHKVWISLRAGEIREGLGLIIGVHPLCCPSATPMHINGVAVVTPDVNISQTEQVEVLGLFRVEPQPDGSRR